MHSGLVRDSGSPFPKGTEKFQADCNVYLDDLQKMRRQDAEHSLDFNVADQTCSASAAEYKQGQEQGPRR
jgi:hypothetical protein